MSHQSPNTLPTILIQLFFFISKSIAIFISDRGISNSPTETNASNYQKGGQKDTNVPFRDIAEGYGNKRKWRFIETRIARYT